MVNIPLPAYTAGAGFRHAVELHWQPALERFRPECCSYPPASTPIGRTTWLRLGSWRRTMLGHAAHRGRRRAVCRRSHRLVAGGAQPERFGPQRRRASESSSRGLNLVPDLSKPYVFELAGRHPGKKPRRDHATGSGRRTDQQCRGHAAILRQEYVVSSAGAPVSITSNPIPAV